MCKFSVDLLGHPGAAGVVAIMEVVDTKVEGVWDLVTMGAQQEVDLDGNSFISKEKSSLPMNSSILYLNLKNTLYLIM